MDNICKVMEHMVNAGMEIQNLRGKFVRNDREKDPLFEAWGELLEAIYCLVGEHKEMFNDSATSIVMNAPILSNERRTKMLMSEYRKHHPEQPKPDTVEPDQMRDMVRQNGGYRYETPEGEWR